MTTATVPDPFLEERDALRLRELRALRQDEAVTVADLTFALDRYEQLASNLDLIRANAAHNALARAALEDAERRRASLTGHLDAVPPWVGAAGLIALVLIAIGLIAQALPHR
jgi:hypothetical protein